MLKTLFVNYENDLYLIINFLQFGKYLYMVVSLFGFVLIGIYMFVVCIIIRFKKNNRLNHKEFPKLYLKKDGISFVSGDRHRIRVVGFEVVSVKECLYLFNATKIIVIENVTKVETNEDFLYFEALGEVKIYLDLTDVYKYFSIIIKSEKFNIENLKQKAIVDVINSNFEAKSSKIVQKYIKIIKNVLNINIFSKKIIIKPNRYHLPFIVTYKINNKIKHIKVE